MYTCIILLAHRTCEWPTCSPLSAWTHIPALAGCWSCSPKLTGMVPACDCTHGGLVLAGPGLQHGKSRGTLWLNATPGAGAEPELCSSPGKQACAHPCKGSIYRVLLMLPCLKDCSLRRGLPNGSTGLLPSPRIYQRKMEQHCCLHPKWTQAQAGTTSTNWELGNKDSLEMSLTALFVGRIYLEVLAHVIEWVMAWRIWELKATWEGSRCFLSHPPFESSQTRWD